MAPAPTKKKWILGAVLACVALWLLGSYLGTASAMRTPPEWRKLKARPEDYGLRAETVSFRSSDGVPLRGWWIPAQGEPHGTVILAHGISDNRSEMVSRAAFLVRGGYNALPLDLRGHGESGGDYFTPGYKEALDILGAVQYARQRGERGPFVAMGHSYGAVAALQAAAQSAEIAAVISDSAFISAIDLLERVVARPGGDQDVPLWERVVAHSANSPLLDLLWRPGFYLRTGVNLDLREAAAITAVPRIGARPILFIAGDRDGIAPPENARRMYTAALGPEKTFLLVPGAGHNTTYGAAPKLYESAVLAFLQRVLPQ